jgi:hypothetical protein
VNWDEQQESPWSSEGRTLHNVGIEVHGGRAIVLILAGWQIPVERAMTFTTVADGQRAVEVRIVRCALQRELRGTAFSARPTGVIGRFLLPCLRNGRRGDARIEVGISLDGAGVIRAWGVDRSTGTRQETMFAGLWAIVPEARSLAHAALSQRVGAAVARSGLQEGVRLRKEQRFLKDLTVQRASGHALVALAGEICAMGRSTAAPTVCL